MGNTILSFSGGKDSVFALYKLKQAGVPVVALITTVWEESGESVAHNETTERLEQQADSLGIPIYWVSTDFDSYGEDFEKKLHELKDVLELERIAFGDIYLKGHREWGEELARIVGLEPVYPLWTKEEDAYQLLDEFVDAGFQAIVTKVDREKLPADWVGRELDESFIRDILRYENVCPLGESGEYHTRVYDGPIFTQNLPD